MPSNKPKEPKIFVLSGGTGRTAKQLLDAAMAQFPDSRVEVIYKRKLRSAKKAVECVEKASQCGALICHSLVVPSVRRAVDTASVRLAVPCIDVLGPSLALIGDHLNTVPRGRAGLLYEVHREQFERMDAMDFTLAHDDGQRLKTLKEADLVLVGASRTTKSVTCCYLAFRGMRAANVPLIPGQILPKELERIDPKRVIGLTMSATHLEAIRQTRLDRISHRPVAHYAELRDIQRELREIRDVFTGHHWQFIDVSYKATEEVAEQIVEMLPGKRRRTSKTTAKRATA